MGTRKRHSQTEIAVKLAKAEALIATGMRQQEVARTLGVSVMTYHRWRKANSGHRDLQSVLAAHASGALQIPEAERLGRIADLELENARLRRLVTDLLLEKIKLEQAVPARQLDEATDSTAHSPH
jgi:transcriptional regulator with XRE-family HTH domain